MGKRKLKVVLDTNVLISALLFQGELSKLLLPLKKGAYILLFSEGTLSELIKVLHYPKFALTEEEIDYIFQFEILPYSKMIKITFKIDEKICKDRDDQKFLELAISGKADYLVSGDTDLLELKEFETIKILSSAEFLEILKG